MKRYAENVLVSIKVKLMECWADSAWPCIFHFWKCVTQGIKAPFENKAADPVLPKLSLPLSFFLSLSLSLFSGWSPEAQRPSEFTFLPRLLRPSQESTLRFHPIERALVASVNRASPVSGALLAFCVNQGISASFSLLYSLADAVHPEGIPGSCWGWTPAPDHGQQVYAKNGVSKRWTHTF